MSRRGMEPRFTRSVTFTVRAFPDQAKRWEAAAALQSGAAAGDWLGEVADAYLKDVTRSGKPLPLKWYHAWFRVLLKLDTWTEAREVEVSGRAAGPFAIFRGSSRGLAEPPHFCYSLVHRPTHRIIGTFGRRKDCEMLASELMPLRVNWEETDPEKVVGGAPDEKRVQEIFHLHQLVTGP